MVRAAILEDDDPLALAAAADARLKSKISVGELYSAAEIDAYLDSVEADEFLETLPSTLSPSLSQRC